MSNPLPAKKAPQIESIGQERSTISVEISARFLQHFSEQLYSSPQKAFEELISNGWDAGADRVDVRISPDLKTATSPTMAILDNGASMDEEGLRQLWHIAFSPKSGKAMEHGRPIIGKFGIGKLATYVLANKLTYICEASDGKIRRVTMDYGEIDSQMKRPNGDKLVRDIELKVFEVTQKEVQDALDSVYGGLELFELIRKGIPAETPISEDEYGGMKTPVERNGGKTWTLVVLSDLKKPGRELKVGVLKRMLAAALPFGSEMAITINETTLVSSKLDTQRLAEWVIGPDLGIDSVEVETAEEDFPELARSTQTPNVIQISSADKPVPHVNIPGIGIVTGRVALFGDPIAGGKSEERGASNGFHVNVLGRVVNQDSPTFGENNLNHASWSRFRMTVRADGLNAYLTTDRERFKDTIQMRVFRAFYTARLIRHVEHTIAMLAPVCLMVAMFSYSRLECCL